jgi:probable metal-binding protein
MDTGPQIDEGRFVRFLLERNRRSSRNRRACRREALASIENKQPHKTEGLMSTSNEEVHGHEVMRMMVESGESYDEKNLEAAIHAKFGESARFCTCSASGMTASELIEFLAAKGKFVPASTGFSTHPSKICDH